MHHEWSVELLPPSLHCGGRSYLLWEPMRWEQWVESALPAGSPATGRGLWQRVRRCFLVTQGDLQSQAMVRAVARQVCEQLIQSKCITVSDVLLCSLSKRGSAMPRS